MKNLLGILIASAIMLIGCDDSPGGSLCQDSVKILTPNTIASEQSCPRGAKLKITDKDASLIAVCRCTENHVVDVDAGTEDKK